MKVETEVKVPAFIPAPIARAMIYVFIVCYCWFHGLEIPRNLKIK